MLTQGLREASAAIQVALKAYQRREEEVQAELKRAAAIQASSAATATATASRPSRTKNDDRSARQGDYDSTMVEMENGNSARGPRLQQMDATEAEVDMHGHLVDEFSQSVTSLENDIQSLAQSMNQIANITQEQGEILDNIESNMGRAEDQSAGAVQQIEQAGESQRRGNKRLWYILLFVALVTIVLVCILAFRK